MRSPQRSTQSAGGSPALDRRHLGRQAEGVEAEAEEHGVAAGAAEARVGVADRVVADVAHVQVARGERAGGLDVDGRPGPARAQACRKRARSTPRRPAARARSLARVVFRASVAHGWSVPKRPNAHALGRRGASASAAWTVRPLTGHARRGETRPLRSNAFEGRGKRRGMALGAAAAICTVTALGGCGGGSDTTTLHLIEHAETDTLQHIGPANESGFRGARACLRQPCIRLRQQEPGRQRQRQLCPHRAGQSVRVHLDGHSRRRPAHRGGAVLRRRPGLGSRDHRRHRPVRDLRADEAPCAQPRKKPSTTSSTKSTNSDGCR